MDDKLFSEIKTLRNERDSYRYLVHEVLKLIHEGQRRGVQDASVNRMTSRYDVAKMTRLEAELERLERVDR